MQFIIKLKTGSKEFNKSTRFPVSITASEGMLAAGGRLAELSAGARRAGFALPHTSQTGTTGTLGRAGRCEPDLGKWGLLHRWGKA